MPVRILHLGEIVGKPGVFCIKSRLQSLRKELGIDLVIANGDGTTQGYGLGKNHAMYLRKLGVDVITAGDMAYYKKDLVQIYDQVFHLVRPANLPPDAPGRGLRFINANGKKFAIISLLGMSGFSRMHGANPFLVLPDLVKRAREESPFVIVDFHCVTTAEKETMNQYVAGKITALFGTGLRTLTADAEVLPGGTACISDCGRTGSIISVQGFDPGPEIEQFINGVPEKSKEAWLGLEIQGCLVDVDDTGKATQVKTMRIPITEVPDDTGRDNNED